MSNTTTTCKFCHEQHQLQYMRTNNSTSTSGKHVHMFYECPTHRRRVMVPKVERLPLPVVDSRRLTKQKQQPELPL